MFSRHLINRALRPFVAQSAVRRTPFNRAFCSSSSPHVFDVVDYDDFQNRIVQSSVPVIVDFHANWCGPCKMLGPRIETAVDQRGGEVLLAKIDIDELGDLAVDYGVQAVPTVIAFRGGQPVAQFSGNVDDQALEEFVNATIEGAEEEEDST